MVAQRFARLVSLAGHPLATPLATVNGFAKTLTRGATLGEREARFVGLITSAADQMASLLDMLALAARIESDRYEPVLAAGDTLELATSADERIATEGWGETIETDVTAVRGALESLARCTAVYGGPTPATSPFVARLLTPPPLRDPPHPPHLASPAPLTPPPRPLPVIPPVRSPP